jgi:PTH1 family peptidyl-tRNA hydrolase
MVRKKERYINKIMKIIVGLGNPGNQYQKSRHNIGFMFLDFLADKDWKFDKKFNAMILEQSDRVLIKPMTFMNNSGLAVRSFLDYYKLLPKKFGIFTNKNIDLSETLTVIHDDLDLDFGRIKTSINSSDAGHRGVKSIIDHIKTKNFKRIRFGINNEYRNKIPVENFVLQNFSKEELEQLNDLYKKIDL